MDANVINIAAKKPAAAAKGEALGKLQVARLECSRCGAEVDAACTCGAPYVPAGARAAVAVAANPGKSDRAIADEIGVGKDTVRRARSTGACAPVEKRTGKDGKARKPPGRAPEQAAVPQVSVERDGVEGPAVVSRLEKREKRRRECFRKAVAIIFGACTTAADIEFPRLSAGDAAEAVEDLKEASAALNRFMAKAEGAQADRGLTEERASAENLVKFDAAAHAYLPKVTVEADRQKAQLLVSELTSGKGQPRGGGVMAGMTTDVVTTAITVPIADAARATAEATP